MSGLTFALLETKSWGRSDRSQCGIFIRVHDQDVERWIAFFEQDGIETAINECPDSDDVDGDIYYVLQPTPDGIEQEWIDGNPAIPLERAIEQMMENRPAYEPALEIIAEEYDVNVEAFHHETAAES